MNPDLTPAERIIKNTLRFSRMSAGLTARDASDFLKITPQYLSRLETGRQIPSQKLLEQMIERYGVADEVAENLRRAYRAASAGREETEGDEDSKKIKSVTQAHKQLNLTINALKTPVLYTDAVVITSDNFGVVVNAGQKAGGADSDVHVIARVGFSYEHAVEIRDALNMHIKKLKEQRESKMPPKKT